MAATREDLRPHESDTASPEVGEPARTEPTRPRDADRIVLLGAWLVAISAFILFEPTPAAPQASIAWWIQLIGLVFTVGFGATIAGLMRSAPWAYGASAIAGATGLFLGVGCIVTAHHNLTWAIGETVVFGMLLGLTWVAAARQRSGA